MSGGRYGRDVVPEPLCVQMSPSDRDRSSGRPVPVPAIAAKRPWQAPALTQLPRLVKLTLQTGGAGGGVGGGVGGTGGTGGFGF